MISTTTPWRRTSIEAERRWALLERGNFACSFCGARPGNDQLKIDQIVPHSWGGSAHDNNLIAVCTKCSNGRRAKCRIPSKMRDGFVGRDGWVTWRRWGEWHLMVADDGDAAALTFQPDGRDYWIEIRRVHELDWHEHIEEKVWMRDDADREDVLPAPSRLPLFELDAVAVLAVDAYEDPPTPPARGSRWANFCDSITFARSLIMATR